jgi:hypothetical protein
MRWLSEAQQEVTIQLMSADTFVTNLSLKKNDFSLTFLDSDFMHALLTGKFITGNYSGKEILGNEVPSFSFAMLRSP